ncbi:MAG: hypothetical protein IKG21_11380 [Atopobiaceae bacterium]|nr:hypothetical protein [Atopobiaceae bacterium]
MSFSDVRAWYDGYEVTENVPHVVSEHPRRVEFERHDFSLYSPFSVVQALVNGSIRNWWNKTEAYEALAKYIRMDCDGLKAAVALLMDRGRLKIDLGTYQNDMTTFHGRDDVLALLIHLGYLGWADDEDEVFIPNKEILSEFRNSTKAEEWKEPLREYEVSKELVKATWNIDESRVAELLEIAHDRAENKTYNSEAAATTPPAT